MSENVIILPATLRGVVARWAVMQSPYDTGPDGLSDVLKELTKRCKDYPGASTLDGGHAYLELVPEAVDAFLDHVLLSQPEVQKWNERKNGRQGMGMHSLYWPDPEPDDDFIDLDALKNNIRMELAGPRRSSLVAHAKQGG